MMIENSVTENSVTKLQLPASYYMLDVCAYYRCMQHPASSFNCALLRKEAPNMAPE